MTKNINKIVAIAAVTGMTIGESQKVAQESDFIFSYQDDFYMALTESETPCDTNTNTYREFSEIWNRLGSSFGITVFRFNSTYFK